MRDPGRLAALVLALVLALGLAGCGDDDSETTSTTTTAAEGPTPRVPPSLVSGGDIARQDAGSPSEALLEWWQAVQFSDENAAIDLTDENVLDEIGPRRFERFVAELGPSRPGIEIVAEEEDDDVATVRVLLINYEVDKHGQPLPTSTGDPTSFNMRDSGDGWRFAALPYLESLIDQQRSSEP